MIIVTDSRKLQYELANVARLFFPSEDIQWHTKAEPGDSEHAIVIVGDSINGNTRELAVTLSLPGKEPEMLVSSFMALQQVSEHIELGKLLYRLLARLTGREIEWGVLTGIRPVKLAHAFSAGGATGQEIEERFVREYLTSPQKAAICRLTESVQRDIVASTLPKGYSLYIAIPFCPSRCSYCSFVSHSTEKSAAMIPEYVDKLCLEIEETAKIASAKGLVLQTVYIGGGTPTTLSAEQLERVLATVRRCFDLSLCSELTVEAGRPDTITAEKLEVLRRMGVGRVSVNCQTLNDKVLEAVGRRHTAKQFLESFHLVEQFGFEAINVDLIAGLPGDDLASFEASLRSVMDLHPQNITVHTLTVKRAARLHDSKSSILGRQNRESSEVSDMVNLSQQLLSKGGYLPYYLYRQKGTIESLENVGYTLPGQACRYNIFIMDEMHTILSVGAGGVTKAVMLNENRRPGDDSVRIERIFNLKYPYEYLQRFDTMIDKKSVLLDFPI